MSNQGMIPEKKIIPLLILIEKENIISLSIKTKLKNIGLKIEVFKNITTAQAFYADNFNNVKAIILNLDNCNSCSDDISIFTIIKPNTVIIGLNSTMMNCEKLGCHQPFIIAGFIKKPFMMDELTDEIMKIISE